MSSPLQCKHLLNTALESLLVAQYLRIFDDSVRADAEETTILQEVLQMSGFIPRIQHLFLLTDQTDLTI
jgi:hypothetical protein